MSGMSTYLNSLSTQVDNINSCDELLGFKTKVEEQLNKLISDMTVQQAKLIEMSVPPTDLATTINWIKNQIDLVIKPSMTMIQEIQEVTTAMSNISSKISDKASSLGCPWGQP